MLIDLFTYRKRALGAEGKLSYANAQLAIREAEVVDLKRQVERLRIQLRDAQARVPKVVPPVSMSEFKRRGDPSVARPTDAPASDVASTGWPFYERNSHVVMVRGQPVPIESFLAKANRQHPTDPEPETVVNNRPGGGNDRDGSGGATASIHSIHPVSCDQ